MKKIVLALLTMVGIGLIIKAFSNRKPKPLHPERKPIVFTADEMEAIKDTFKDSEQLNFIEVLKEAGIIE